MAFAPLHLWNRWEIQTLVILSLGLQVFLLLFAGIRRRKSSVLLRFPLWLAYLMADSTANYALGHLSLSSAVRQHKLVAFWAPFLLLHLGGPDNITAYALQDNQLWLRHLQNLVVQVLGAGYVLYKHTTASDQVSILLLPTILMFIVGLVKYGERTWALRCSNISSIRSSLNELPGKQFRWYNGHLQNKDHRNSNNDEFLLQRAHSLFHICKRGIVDSVIDVETEIAEANSTRKIIKDLMSLKEEQRGACMWKVMEMELSLMYDILYTKAAVIHTLIGYCIRALSPITIATSLMLFHFSNSRYGQDKVDITVTYVLLGSGLVMETMSLLTALGSSWTLAFLCTTRWSWLQHTALCAGRWHRLRRAVLTLRGIFARGCLGRSRKLPGTIGQFNLLCFRAAQVRKLNRRSEKLARKLGFGEWWDRTCYSWTVKIPEIVKVKALYMVSDGDLNTMGLLRHKWGEVALGKLLEGDLKDWHGVDFHESIISWHIATDMLLSKKENIETQNINAGANMAAIRALSNYMMFLIVNRPEMVPGLPQNWLYQRTCEKLDHICKDNRQRLVDSSGKDRMLFFPVLSKLPCSRSATKSSGLKLTKELACILHEYERVKADQKNPRLRYAQNIAEVLLAKEKEKKIDVVDALLDLWTDFLIYAANRCNRESHAKKLNTGGEFITVVWLMVEHIYQTKRKI